MEILAVFWASLYAKVFFYFQLLKNMRFWIILLEIFGKKLHEVFQLYRVVLALIFLRKTKGALSLDLTLIYLLRPVHELKLSDCPWLSVAGVRHFKLPQQVLRHVIFSQRIHHKALKYWNIIACQNLEGGGFKLLSYRPLLLDFVFCLPDILLNDHLANIGHIFPVPSHAEREHFISFMIPLISVLFKQLTYHEILPCHVPV